MKKIISLFQRNYDGDRLVRNEIVEGAEWVIQGEGVPTQKLDGTCCMVKDKKLYKRYEIKKGKTPPTDFLPATDVDNITGKQQGWRPVGEGNEDRWHREAFLVTYDTVKVNELDTTYELIGEKIQGNPEKIQGHKLLIHGSKVLIDVPRDFKGIRNYLKDKDIEGIVWHHPNGKMVKIKKKDFGFKR